MNNQQPSAVKSADRVLDVFELLAGRELGLSHSELSESLGIPKSSLTLLIKNLLNRNYVVYDPATKRYQLGPKFGQIASRTAAPLNLVDMIQPILVEIRSSTEESTAFNVLSNNETKVIASVESTFRLLSQMRVGDTAPLYATSSGKAMLAFFSDDRLAEYFATVALEPITSKTITAEDELRAQLAQIRAGSLAEVFEEYTPGIVGLAVPILSRGQEILGAINVSLPALRYSSQARTRVSVALSDAQSRLARQISF